MKQAARRLVLLFLMVSCLDYSLILKTDASVEFHCTTGRNTPDDISFDTDVTSLATILQLHRSYSVNWKDSYE
jgi:hypothetical protein